MNTAKLLAIVVMLQVLILFSQWTGGVAAPARAQIPDAGAQRNAMVEELKTLNAKMDKLIGIFESGKLQVRVAPSDESAKDGEKPAR